jgi:hypothetical protein
VSSRISEGYTEKPCLKEKKKMMMIHTMQSIKGSHGGGHTHRKERGEGGREGGREREREREREESANVRTIVRDLLALPPLFSPYSLDILSNHSVIFYLTHSPGLGPS